MKKRILFCFNTSITKFINVSNYSLFSLKTAGKFMYICRVEELVYVEVDEEYEKDVKKLIKKIGY